MFAPDIETDVNFLKCVFFFRRSNYTENCAWGIQDCFWVTSFQTWNFALKIYLWEFHFFLSVWIYQKQWKSIIAYTCMRYIIMFSNNRCIKTVGISKFDVYNDLFALDTQKKNYDI
jgi:hypothetical protein